MVLTIKFFTRSGPDWSGFLDREARLEGTLEVPGTFRLDGTLRGRILSHHTLVLGEAADVEGEIEARRVEIFGRFRGTLRASEHVQIHTGAVVAGDVHGPCLILEPGGHFDGNCYLLQNGTASEALLVPIRANGQEAKTAG